MARKPREKCLPKQGIFAYSGDMSHETDQLDRVVAELNSPDRVLTTVAKECGIPYDTVLRIKRKENDPGYSKVKRLHDYLFPQPQHPLRRATDHHITEG